ncbi:MAG: hypothetical protein E7373_00435 [Clostridiales bacterium]|nr:hypothetical protein [Clostridiales bacterium]
MSKRKSITLLSIISVLLAIVLVLTFGQFKLDKAGVNKYASLFGAVELDYDLEGGTAYTIALADDNEEEVTDINSVIQILDYRMSALGYGAYSIKAVKSTDKDVLDYTLRIEAKTTESLASDISVVIAHGTLQFFGGENSDSTTEILKDMNVIKKAQYTGATTTTGETAVYGVSFEFTKEAYDELVELIEASSTYHLNIKLGDTDIFSSSITKDNFRNRTLPIVSQSEAGAKQMAVQLKYGGLGYKYEIKDTETVTSPLGADIAKKCAVAIITLSVLSIALLIILYKGFGICTALSMLIFILGEGWLLIGVPGIVLSIGGVVGILGATVLAGISMAILASRVKEEFIGSQKTVKAAINKAFKQTLVPTISVNVACGLVAALLFAFADGLVKNFAITFGIGAVVSVICVLVFTRMFNALILPLAKNKEKFIGFKRLPKEELNEGTEEA